MVNDDQLSPPVPPDQPPIADLIRRLTEAEAALQAALSDQVDVVIDPASATPFLLRRAQDALRRSETRYNQLMARLAAVIFELEPDETIRFVNDAVTAVTGYQPGELMRRNWREIFFPGELDKQVDDLVARWQSGDVTAYELTLCARDGRLLVLELNSANRYREDGTLDCVVGLGIDITARKHAENELMAYQAHLESLVAERTAQLQAILDNMTDGLIITEPDTQRIYHNPASMALHGYSSPEEANRSQPETLSDWQVMDLDGNLLPDDAGPIKRALRGERYTNYEVRLRRVDTGREFIGSYSGTPVYDSSGRMLYALVIARDITEQKRAETELVESEARYRAIGEAIPFGVWMCDASGRATYLSQSFLDMVGKTLQECREFGWADRLVPGTAEQTLADWQACVANETMWNYEHRFVGKDGRIYTILSRGVPLRDAEGHVTSWIGVNLDITERKRIEQAEHDQRVLAEALNQIAMGLSSTLKSADVLDIILASVGELVAYETVDLMLIDEQGWTTVASSRGFDAHSEEARLKFRRFDYREFPLLRQIAESRQPVVVPDITTCDDWVDVGDHEWRRSYVGVPVLLHNKIIGFLNVTSLQPDFFTPPVVERLQTLANQAALAVQNARLYEQAMVAAAARERDRLARELHDVVSQTLFSASLVAEALPRQWQRDPERAFQQLGELLQLTRMAQAEMRTLLLELRPNALIEADMKVLLPQLVDSIRSRRGMDISVTVDEQMPLEPEVKVSFYRIAQEALNNVVKHSEATKVEIHFSAQPPEVRLAITDNGRGFDPETVSATSLGLGIMRERAVEAGALLTVTSAPGQGTQVTVCWPNAPA